MKSNLSKEQYMSLFCQRVKIINRYPVYVSERTHDILKRTVANMGIYRLSISTLIENIIVNHLETYASQIKEIHQNEWERLFPEEEEEED